MENLEQKMLREIANDKITPKKYNFKVDSELFDSENEISVDAVKATANQESPRLVFGRPLLEISCKIL